MVGREISLQGNAEMITEFFHYSINNILYQRCIYPASHFEFERRYGLSLMVIREPTVASYLQNTLSQIRDWITMGQVQKVVLVFMGSKDQQAKERWTFNVVPTEPGTPVVMQPNEDKTTAIAREIQTIMRQITASVSFLPVVQETVVFDLLVYCDKNTEIPQSWEQSLPQCILGGDNVKLSGFNTKIHRVEGLVNYRYDD